MLFSPAWRRNAISSPRTDPARSLEPGRIPGVPEPGGPPPTWVFWDGDCALCARCAAWGESRDRRDRLRFVPWQEAPSPPLTAEIARRAPEAVQVLTPHGTRLEAGRAVLHVVEELGHPRLARLLRTPPLVWAIEAGYRLVARNRGRVGRWLLRGNPPPCDLRGPDRR